MAAAVAGKAGYGTVDATGIEIYGSAQGPCMSIWIACESVSAVNLLVCVPSLHGTDWLRLTPGGPPFICRDSTLSGTDNLTSVSAKGEGGTATLSWGVAASGKA